jgi:hypothetical protein
MGREIERKFLVKNMRWRRHQKDQVCNPGRKADLEPCEASLFGMGRASEIMEWHIV